MNDLYNCFVVKNVFLTLVCLDSPSEHKECPSGTTTSPVSPNATTTPGDGGGIARRVAVSAPGS